MRNIEHRQHRRYRVHLSVRFETAADFVSQYAENLSAGGLFVRGAERLERTQTVPVELDLPGFGRFEVTARVAFILDEDSARAAGRHAGAGLEILNRPPGFETALTEYLVRLGKRRDHAVYTDSAMIRAALEGAGYRARSLPPPDALAAELEKSNLPVVGVVVSRARASAYEQLPATKQRLRIYEDIDTVDRILSELDAMVSAD